MRAARSCRHVIAAALAALIGLGGAHAWVTTAGEEQWPAPGGEHVRLTQETLARLGVAEAFENSGGPTVTDLRAAYFNATTNRDEPPDQAAVLPSRPLLPVAAWAGLPDRAYTLYDWIDGRRHCPARAGAEGDDDRCYPPSGWLDAGFESVHYGSQAAAMYERFHAVALAQAAQARKLRENIAEAGAGAWRDAEAYRDWIREAELLALAYEGMAQHFLQDRWSAGHMWERWGAGDYDSHPYAGDAKNAFALSLIGGVLHGGAAGRNWKVPGSTVLHSGAGDGGIDRLLADGETALAAQREALLTCGAASYAEVIATFGENGRGGYGVHDARPAVPYRSMKDLDIACLAPWLTNRSITRAWHADERKSLSRTARLTFPGSRSSEEPSSEEPDGRAAPSPIANRKTLTQMVAGMEWSAWTAPEATDLARGGMGALGTAEPGDAYLLPDYLPPRNPENLPDRSETIAGRDKETIYGFFSRGRADYSCGRMPEILADLRGPGKSAREKALCRHFADHVYFGTDPEYEGAQREIRTLGWQPALGQAVHPICWMVPGDSQIRRTGLDDSMPVYLRPGYVESAQPYRLSGDGRTPQSLAHWCEKTPVLDLIRNDRRPALLSDDVVALVRNESATVALTGLHLGNAVGRVELTDATGRTTEIAGDLILRWRDDAVTFVFPDDFILPQEDLRVVVHRADGTATAGRFVIRRGIEHPQIERLVLRRGGEIFYDYRRRDAPPVRLEEILQDRPAPAAGPRDEAEAFRPVTAGPITMEVTFDRVMDPAPPVGPEAPHPIFALAGLDAEGLWTDERTWRGTITLSPADFTRLRGFHPVRILARSKEGGWSDGDPETPEAEPLETHRILIDSMPVYLENVEVKKGWRQYYDAGWRGGPRPRAIANVKALSLARERRKLVVETAKALPADGTADIALRFSGALDGAPTVRIGGTEVRVRRGAEPGEWLGQFDLAAARSGMTESTMLLTVEARDPSGKGLDGNPRTLAWLDDSAFIAGAWWRAYEDRRGGRTTPEGGRDLWHRPGEPPVMSLVIVLDASGSMEDDGRMANAKEGIDRTLSTLTAEYEVGTVVFFDCNDIRVSPFTRNIPAVRDYLLSITPAGNTSYARALDTARSLFLDSAHPASRQWTYVPFTDGFETCNGNVVAALKRLDSAVAEHRLALSGDLAQTAPDRNGTPGGEPACTPESWRRYDIERAERFEQADALYLLDTFFWERRMPSGRCVVRLQTRRYAVEIGGASATGRTWQVARQPASQDAIFASSDQGRAALQAVRKQAEEVRQRAGTLEEVRPRLDSAAEAILAERQSP